MINKCEVKSGCKGYIFKDIGRQQEKSEKRKWIEENGGVSSPMLMTFLKQGLAEGSENLFNVSNTIENQSLEGGVGNHVNMSKTTGKPVFEERGVATCTKQCKTSDIGKCNPSWMMHNENFLHECGASLLSGGDWSGLNLPVLLSDSQVGQNH